MSSRSTAVQQLTALPAASDVILKSATGLVALWLIAFWSLVVRARLATGVWPQPQSGNPLRGTYQPSTIDPKVFGLHTWAVWGGIPLLYVVVPSFVALLLLSVFVNRLRPTRSVVLAFVATSALAIATWVCNPFDFTLWFVD